MEYIIVGGLFVLLIVIAILTGTKKKNNNDLQIKHEIEPISEIQEIQQEEKFPYILVDSVMSEKENKFCKSLIPIANKLGLNIFIKMRLADLVYVPKNHPEYMRWFNYIKAKHVDFILCRVTKPVLLIEVDDYTHDRPSRQKRDEFVDKIFKQVGLPILHFRQWTENELETKITQTLTH